MRLYAVTLTLVVPVAAESEAGALRLAMREQREILDTEAANVELDVEEVETLPDGWAGCYPWGRDATRTCEHYVGGEQ